MEKKIYIVIPIFNEGSVIQDVIKEIRRANFQGAIIVVDDGSNDNSNQISHIIQKNSVIFIRHLMNRGKGAAVKTGIEAAKILDADVVVTMDGDGQHNPENINKMLRLIDQGYDVVLGSRLKNPKGMPVYKIIANYLGNFFTWLIYGLWVTDSQSGFRAYSRKAIYLIETRTDRYEYDSEVIREICRNKLKYIEVPIEVRYTEYSTSKAQKQGIKNGVKTLFKMFISG